MLLVLTALTFASLFLLACSSAAAHAPVQHPDIIECGGPMAQQVAKRAADIALANVTAGTTADQLEQLIVNEITVIAAEHGGGFAECLIERALNAQRQRLTAMPPRLMPPHRLVAGFVPLERDPDHSRPWHTLLAGARGVRS
jgi:hypothetical protein